MVGCDALLNSTEINPSGEIIAWFKMTDMYFEDIHNMV